MGESSRWLGGTSNPPSHVPGALHSPPSTAPLAVHRTRLLVKTVLAAAGLLVALLVAIPFIVPHQTLPMAIIVFISIFIVIAALVAGIAGSYLFLTRGAGVGPLESPAAPTLRPAVADTPDRELEHLILRVLDGDELQLKRVLLTTLGEALQRDLVRSTSFSEAKISRLLDRLEGRGLVVRERQGMTNRVRATLRQT